MSPIEQLLRLYVVETQRSQFLHDLPTRNQMKESENNIEKIEKKK